MIQPALFLALHGLQPLPRLAAYEVLILLSSGARKVRVEAVPGMSGVTPEAATDGITALTELGVVRHEGAFLHTVDTTKRTYERLRKRAYRARLNEASEPIVPPVSKVVPVENNNGTPGQKKPFQSVPAEAPRALINQNPSFSSEKPSARSPLSWKGECEGEGVNGTNAPTGTRDTDRRWIWPQLAGIYAAYPTHRQGGKGPAARAIENALNAITAAGTHPDPLAYLLGRVQAYARSWLAHNEGGKAVVQITRFMDEALYEQPDAAWADPARSQERPKLKAGAH